ncbi:hypothetical protein MTO96_005324 [Rhipicephalus appendiculatus]
MKMVQALTLAVTLGVIRNSVGQGRKANVVLAANNWKGEAVVTQSIRVAEDPDKETVVAKRYKEPASRRSSTEAANFVYPEAALRRPVASGVTYIAEPTGAQAVPASVEFKTEPSAAATGYGGGGGGGGHGGGGYGGYFQYARVPGYNTYEFGYRKGNPYHFQERHETRHGPHFRTKQRWGDKHGGYGEHYWEYNHAPKYH